MTDAGTRPSRPRRPAPPPKPKTPTWVVVVFIGVPSVLIVIMLGIIIKQRLFDGGAAPVEAPKVQASDPNVMKKEADALYQQARKLKAQALAKQKDDKDASFEIKAAMDKFQQAQQKYYEIIDGIRAANKGALPADYRGYEREVTKIQQELLDTVKMKSLK